MNIQNLRSWLNRLGETLRLFTFFIVRSDTLAFTILIAYFTGDWLYIIFWYKMTDSRSKKCYMIHCLLIIIGCSFSDFRLITFFITSFGGWII